MTLYNPIRDTSPANPVVSNDNVAYVFGLSFSVSSASLINGVWWYCDIANGQIQNLAANEQIALWTVTGLHSGTYVSGSVTSAGTYVQGWNLISFGSPVSLAGGTEYMAVKGVGSIGSSINYSATGGFFASGGAGGAGFSDGPVLVYSSGDAGAPGSSHKEPNGNGQMSFFAGSSGSAPPNVTTSFPAGVFNGGWYGLDVQISSSAAATVTYYGMRLS